MRGDASGTWSSRRGPRSDRGEIGLFAAIVALLAGAAVAGVMIDVAAPTRRAAPAVFVQITSARAARTANDELQLTLSYRAGVAPDSSGPAPWESESKIICIASERNGGSRSGSGHASLFILPATSRDATMTITLGYVEANPNATVTVSCDITREGQSYHSGVVEVAIPAPQSPSGSSSGGNPSGAFTDAPYVGTYRVTFTTVVGIVLNCGPRVVTATVDVSALTDTRIKVEVSSAAVGGVSTGFETDLAPTAQFSGELPSLGLLTGRFADRSGRTWLTGKATSPDGHCTWSVEGPK